jgi:hypothetical protein
MVIRSLCGKFELVFISMPNEDESTLLDAPFVYIP